MVLENGNKLLRFTAELDPTRPIFSNLGSVSLDAQGGGKIDVGKVYEPLLAQISPFEGHKLRLGYPVSSKTFTMLGAYCSSKEGKAIADGVHGNKSFWERYNYLKDEISGKVLVDGLGVPTFPDLDALADAAKPHAQNPETKDLNKFRQELGQQLAAKGVEAFSNAGDFLKAASQMAQDALVKQLQGLLTNIQVSGYILEQFGDHGLHFNGLVDWTRKPKPVLDSLQKANHPVWIFAEATDRTPYGGTSAAINAHLFNEGPGFDFTLAYKVKGPNGRTLHQESHNGRAKGGVNALGTFKFPVGFETGRFTIEVAMTRQGKEAGKAEEALLVPAETKLEGVLKKVRLIGDFSDSITVSASAKADCAVLYGIAEISENELREALETAKAGGTVILGALTEEDCRQLNGLKLLPQDLNPFRCTGGAHGNFHYLNKHPLFKHLDVPGLLDQTYADVQPLWSLDRWEDAVIPAGSLNFLTTTGAKSKIRWGMDAAFLPFGKGKLAIFQYDIFSKLGRNALADRLFANLIDAV